MAGMHHDQPNAAKKNRTGEASKKDVTACVRAQNDFALTDVLAFVNRRLDITVVHFVSSLCWPF
jgi:hypothetical protein